MEVPCSAAITFARRIVASSSCIVRFRLLMHVFYVEHVSHVKMGDSGEAAAPESLGSGGYYGYTEAAALLLVGERGVPALGELQRLVVVSQCRGTADRQKGLRAGGRRSRSAGRRRRVG